MTTVFLTEKKCFMCGSKNRYPEIGSTFSIIGSKDLDGRPSQIHRSSVYMWIQRCMNCGYCAPEISEGRPEFRSLVESKEYTSQLSNPEYPETSNAFLCRAILLEAVSHFAQAGWAALYAAWVCDDNNFSAMAGKCRRMALDYYEKARANGQMFAELPEQEDTSIIDLHRRLGSFELARSLCTSALQHTHSDRILDILYFEQKLIDAGDTACHNDTEAEESED